MHFHGWIFSEGSPTVYITTLQQNLSFKHLPSGSGTYLIFLHISSHLIHLNYSTINRIVNLRSTEKISFLVF